ncbi:MAG: FAD:protein FMN transferase [Deltaproteobacteria bacterium]|nr:FAD:protein FMN transferase [Deltaproteobacteria bacterium]
MEKDMQRLSGGIDRRDFLKLSGILGVGLTAAAALPASAEAVKFDRKLYKVSETRLAMGTFVSMTLLHSSRDQAEIAIGTAFKEIDRLTRDMSRFDQTTAVAQLNREGRLKDVPPDMANVVKRALAHHRTSNGAFDISVKPVVDLFKNRFSGKNPSPPTGKEVREALKLVDASSIQLAGNSILLKKPGMGITLDGIAKGYIVDKASDALSEFGIENYLINAGGDIRTSGRRQDGKPWTIAVQDPHKKQRYPDKIKLTDGAIATSGNYEVYFDREKMFHHIVNPQNGFSPDASTSVSVLAETAMDADALSTSVFVMRPEKGIRFVNSLPGCECLVVGKGNRKMRSTGWKSIA